MPPLHVTSPSRIPVPGGKVIDEYVGRVNGSEQRVSVAHMRAPAGWTEPGQRPEFDEWTVVLVGALHVEYDGGALVVHGGEAVHTPAGEWVRYRTGDEGAEYVAVCLPAFGPGLAHRDGE